MVKKNTIFWLTLNDNYYIVAIVMGIKKNNLFDQKQIMNFQETCDFLGIHPSTLNKWKAENKIPYKRLGKRIFFKKEDILNSLKDSNYQKYKSLQSFIN